MKTLIGGMAAALIGLIGLTLWFPALLQLLAGIIPILLLAGGALVVYHRKHDFKPDWAVLRDWNPRPNWDFQFSLKKSAPEKNMNWFTKTVKTSLGLKLFMALTGLSFCIFLAGHMAGNLSLYGGKEMFNSYADHLHSLGVLVNVAEWGLVIMAVLHIVIGLTLFIQNRLARPVRYKVNKNAGGRTIGSATMPYTGILILLFVIIHLLNFHFVDKTTTTIFDIVSAAFANPGLVLFYVLAVLLVAVHVSHGFWSAFQTLGANHPKYMPLIRTLSIVFAVVVGIGFGLLPIFVSVSA